MKENYYIVFTSIIFSFLMYVLISDAFFTPMEATLETRTNPIIIGENIVIFPQEVLVKAEIQPDLQEQIAEVQFEKEMAELERAGRFIKDGIEGEFAPMNPNLTEARKLIKEDRRLGRKISESERLVAALNKDN